MALLNTTAVFASLASLLIAIFLDPDVTSEPMKSLPPTDPDGTVAKIGPFDRLTFSLKVEGKRVHCWLFSPTKPLWGRSPPPVVVAAYGLGVQKDIALVPLATSLADEGFAVVLFDYRHWGVSEGLPRHVADPTKQVEDLQAVLQHIESTSGLMGKVDPNRITLYGTSLGGGIVLAMASRLSSDDSPLKRRIKAVVAAVPFVNGGAAQAAALQRRGILESLRVFGAILRDLVWGLVSSQCAVYLRLATPRTSGEIGAMQLDYSEYEIWASRTPVKGKKAEGAWENKLAARTLQKLAGFHPDRSAVDYLDVPTLVIAGSKDKICPIEPIRQLSESHARKGRRKKVTLKEMPLGHFEFLHPKNFPQLMQTVSDFFKQHI